MEILKWDCTVLPLSKIEVAIPNIAFVSARNSLILTSARRVL